MRTVWEEILQGEQGKAGMGSRSLKCTAHLCSPKWGSHPWPHPAGLLLASNPLPGGVEADEEVSSFPTFFAKCWEEESSSPTWFHAVHHFPAPAETRLPAGGTILIYPLAAPKKVHFWSWPTPEKANQTLREHRGADMTWPRGTVRLGFSSALQREMKHRMER